MTPLHTDEQFYEDLCDALGVGVPGHGPEDVRRERRNAAIRVFRAWEQAEGSKADWNPFDTTWSHEQGATAYNSFGPGGASHVMNYPTRAEGVQATAQTLLHGAAQYGYAEIVHALRDGDAERAAQAIDSSSWGSHGVAKLLGNGGGGQRPDGEKRQHVRQLQDFLATEGHPAEHSRTNGHGLAAWDGHYGPGTERALGAFLTDDGNGTHADHPVHAQVVKLQTFLDHHGVDLSESSRRKDGTFDGHLGHGTIAALAEFLGTSPDQLRD